MSHSTMRQSAAPKSRVLSDVQPLPPKSDGPRVVRITRAKVWTHDPRVQCAADEIVNGPFTVYPPGIDPLTGRAWK